MALANVFRPVRDRLAADTADALDAENGTQRRSEPKSNVFGSGWISNEDLDDTTPKIHWGRIVDIVPFMNAYRVQAEIGLIYICSFGGLTGLQPHGAKSITTLPIGSAVLFVSFHQSHYGLIIATDADYILDPLNHRSDYISQGSHVGLIADPAHDALLTRMRSRGGIPCWAAGRPVDSTGVGEWGAITETGLGVFLDPFMGYFRVDEETGIFMFYHDQFLRVAGHNLQLRSAHAFNEQLDDQLEGHLFSGDTPFHWEALGVFDREITRLREYTIEQTQKDYTQYSLLEPIYDDQQAFSRHLNFNGYLGQGGKEMVCAPPPDATINRYSVDLKHLGTLNIQQALDGSYGIQSAKRIYLTKRIAIPVPKQRYRPEDARGDNETDYAFCGDEGDGPEHVLADGPQRGVDTEGPLDLVKASAILDLGAFTFNWQGAHPFHYHTKDWYLPEECDLHNNVNQTPVTFCDLQTNQFLAAPTPFIRAVDSRLTGVEYFPNESYFVMLDDGGICLGDGYGAEIKMTGGNMYLSAPGDIFIQPGKNLNTWAGWDIVSRAFNSIDLTTTRRDIRLKAENNLMALAGNNGVGGMLLESKSEQTAFNFDEVGEGAKTSGILFKALNSPIMSMGREFVVHTSTPEGQTGGGIQFRSDCDIRMSADYLLSFIDQARIDFFPGMANEYWSNHALFGSNVRVGNQLVVGNGISLNGWMNIINGHVSSSIAAATGPCGATIYGITGDQALSVATDMTVTSERSFYLNSIVSELETNVHDEDVIAALTAAEFSLRTVSDYRTSGFVMFENRWQQLARLGLGTPAKWTELPVATSTVATYPHPGLESLTEDESWYEQNLTIYSIPYGASIDRGYNQEAYEAPEFGTTDKKTMNSNYPIVRVC